MATGKLLRGATGKLLRANDGKLLRCNCCKTDKCAYYLKLEACYNEFDLDIGSPSYCVRTSPVFYTCADNSCQWIDPFIELQDWTKTYRASPEYDPSERCLKATGLVEYSEIPEGAIIIPDGSVTCNDDECNEVGCYVEPVYTCQCLCYTTGYITEGGEIGFCCYGRKGRETDWNWNFTRDVKTWVTAQQLTGYDGSGSGCIIPMCNDEVSNVLVYHFRQFTGADSEGIDPTGTCERCKIIYSEVVVNKNGCASSPNDPVAPYVSDPVSCVGPGMYVPETTTVNDTRSSFGGCTTGFIQTIQERGDCSSYSKVITSTQYEIQVSTVEGVNVCGCQITYTTIETITVDYILPTLDTNEIDLCQECKRWLDEN